MNQELANTLIELGRGLQAPPESGIVVTEAQIDLPLEVSVATRRGEIVFLAAPPHSRWKSGVLPPVHLSRMRFELLPDGG
jgi:hypothetical protein